VPEPKGSLVPTSAETRSIQGQYAAAIRYKKPDSRTLARELAAARISDYVREIVDLAPPLTEAQRERISALLTPAGGASS
jgi:hypothetical protein